MGGGMLIYHPAQDVNHCVYRTLLLLEHTVHNDIEIDLYRLLDFYILFPHLLKQITPLPAELRTYKKFLMWIPEPYETMRNTKRIIHELEPLQTAALQNLLAKQLIDLESFKSKKIRRTEEPLPDKLLASIKSSKSADEEWFRLIINELPTINFGGKKGLKKRTGLMEFRYDLESK